MDDDDRVISPVAGIEELVTEEKIRPQYLSDYIGQPVVREQMEIFILRLKLGVKRLIMF